MTPKLWAGIGAAVVLALLVAFYEVRLRRAFVEAAEAREAATILRAQVAELTGNRDELARVIDEQNRKFGELERRAREMESAAATRAVRELQEGRRRRANIESGTGDTGPERINEWMRGSLWLP